MTSAVAFGPRMLRTLLRLARPKGMLFVALVPCVGFGFSYWDHGCTVPGYGALAPLGLLAMLWAVPHAGTMWLNAALDRDEGPVLFGDGSVPVPAGIEKLGYATLLFAVVAAFAVQLALGLCVLGCAILSVLYSHPRTAWKGHAILGPLANVLGYGVLSPLGGMLLSGLPLTARAAIVVAVSVLFILAAYFAAQAFQEEEDRARNYRTLVALRGARATLAATRLFLVLAALGAMGFAAWGWFPRPVLLAMPAFWISERFLVRWSAQPGGGDEGWARSFFVRLMLAGLLCLGAVSMHYAWLEHHGQPLGGLGTERGHPAMRVCPGNWNSWKPD